MKGSVPARILASGLRLKSVDRSMHYQQPDGEFYQIDFRFYTTTPPPNMLWTSFLDYFPPRHDFISVSYNLDGSGDVTWSVFVKEGDTALQKRTHYWEQMIYKLQQLLP
jgi:hypothetical protein